MSVCGLDSDNRLPYLTVKMNGHAPAPDYYSPSRRDITRNATSNNNSKQADYHGAQTPTQTTRDCDAPPAYDQLSIAPPSDEDSSAQLSSTDTNTASKDNSVKDRSRGSTMKQKWKAMREDDERRRAGRYQTVSAAEADRITALDRYREEQAKRSSEQKSGVASLLGVLFLT